jgi:hypothetical protein
MMVQRKRAWLFTILQRRRTKRLAPATLPERVRGKMELEAIEEVDSEVRALGARRGTNSNWIAAVCTR